MINTSQLARPGSGVRPTPRTWQRVVGVGLAVHAIAHLAGTTRAVSAIDDDRSAEILGGLVTLDTTPMLSIWAVAWAVLAVVTATAAVSALMGRSDARRIVATAALLSLVACVIGLWATIIGVAVNAGLLVTARLPIWSNR